MCVIDFAALLWCIYTVVWVAGRACCTSPMVPC